MSIRKRLPLIIAILVSLSIAAVSIISCYSGSIIIKNDSNLLIKTISDDEVREISALINGEKKEVERFASQKDIIELAKFRKSAMDDSFFDKNNEAVKKTNALLTGRVKALGNLEHAFLMDKNGMIIADSNEASMKGDASKRQYFTDALKGKIAISETMISKSTGAPVIAFAVPVLDDSGEVLGVVGTTVFVDYFSKAMSKIKIGDTGYAYLVDSQGTMLAHPSKDKIAKPVENEVVKNIVKKVQSNGAVQANVEKYVYNGANKYCGYAIVPEVKWILAVDADSSELNAPVMSLFKNISIGAVICLIITLAIAIIISRKITIPLKNLTQTMERAASGDLTVTSKYKSKDELGRLAISFNEMVSKMRKLIFDINELMNSVQAASKVLSETTEETAKSITEVAEAVQNIAEGAGHQAEQAQNGVQKITVLSDEIVSVGVNGEKMKQDSDDINEMNKNGKQIVETLVEKTKENQDATGNVVTIIHELRDKSMNIGKIMETISSISQQTNLLALNAAIEAARAGEAGKGFSVVAEEVRKLAEESANSAKEIAEIINEMQSKTGDAVVMVSSVTTAFENQRQSVKETGDAFDNISSGVDHISMVIEEVNEALVRINCSKDDIINSITSISSVSQETAASSEEVSASTEEQTAAMEEVSSYTEQLNDMVERLSQAVKIFKI